MSGTGINCLPSSKLNSRGANFSTQILCRKYKPTSVYFDNNIVEMSGVAAQILQLSNLHDHKYADF